VSTILQPLGRDARTLARWLPPAIFIPITVPLVFVLVQGWLAGTDAPAGDAALYRSAALAWLNGGNPWAVGDAHSSFAGSPLTVLAFVPLTVIPEPVFRPTAVIVSWLAGAWLIRRLGLPRYWITFPPLVVAAMLANPGLVAIALTLGPLAWVASMLKIFMVVPTIGERRWTSLAALALIGAASLLVFPDLWWTYVRELPTVAATLATNLHFTSTLYEAPWLLPIAAAGLLALASTDFRAACWLVVPALWPATEYHYGLFVLPAAPALGVFMAIPSAPVATAAIAAYGFSRFAVARLSTGLWRDRIARTLTPAS
jgi:hypothetical protein